MIIMNQDILKHQLHDEYLQTYQKIELLCHNLSFFMNDDGYFQITMQDEALDLLCEAQVHQQPVEYVLEIISNPLFMKDIKNVFITIFYMGIWE